MNGLNWILLIAAILALGCGFIITSIVLGVIFVLTFDIQTVKDFS